MADNSKQVLAMASVVVVVLLLVAGMFAISTSNNDNDKNSTITIINPGENYYNLEIIVEGEGTVTPSFSGPYKKGTLVPVTIMPDWTYIVSSVTLDGNDYGISNYSLNVKMDKDHTLYVKFVKNPSYNPNETIFTGGSATISPNTSGTFIGTLTDSSQIENVSLLFSNEAMSAITSDGQSHTLKIEADTSYSGSGAIIKFSIKIDDKGHDLGTGNVQIRLTLNGEYDVAYIEHKADNGAEETITAFTDEISNGDTVVTFFVSHFSEFTVYGCSGDHAYSQYTYDSNTHRRECSVCHKVESGPHNYKEINKTEATCTSPGEVTLICVCSYEVHETYNVREHNYTTSTTAPTCTTQGYTTYTCSYSDCSHTEIKDYTDPVGHTWDDGTPIQSATCGDYTLYTCTVCEITKEESQGTATHSPSETWTHVGDTHQKICAKCNVILESENCSYGSWNETTPATCTDKGEKTRTCSVCQGTATEEISPLGHVLSPWTVETKVSSDNRNAGAHYQICERGCGYSTEPQKCTYVLTIDEFNGTGTYACEHCTNSYEVTYVAKVGQNYYETVEAAINAANGGTVTLVNNINVNVTISKDVTIIGNGKEICVTSGDAITIGENANVILDGVKASSDNGHALVGGTETETETISIGNLAVIGGEYITDGHGDVAHAMQGEGAIRIYSTGIISVTDAKLRGALHILSYGVNNVPTIRGIEISWDYNGTTSIADILLKSNSESCPKIDIEELVNNNTLNTPNKNASYNDLVQNVNKGWEGQRFREVGTADGFKGVSDGDIVKIVNTIVDDATVGAAVKIYGNGQKATLSYSDVNDIKIVESGSEKLTILLGEKTVVSSVKDGFLVVDATYQKNGEMYSAIDIYSANGLVWFNGVDLKTSEGSKSTITLKDNIDMSGKPWVTKDFKWAIFNGDGKTISNLTCTQETINGRGGLFGYVGGSIIKDLTINGLTAEGAQVAVIGGNGQGCTVENIILKGNIELTWKQNTGDYNELCGAVGIITAVSYDDNKISDIDIENGCTITLDKQSLINTAVTKWTSAHIGGGQLENKTFEGVYAINENGKIIIKYADGFVEYIGSKESVFEISNLNGLKYFRNDVNSGNSYQSKTIKLTSNEITLKDENWIPIGISDASFKGTFDGNGYKISDLIITNRTDEFTGLFGKIESPGIVKNLTVENANIKGKASVGVIAGGYTGKIINCHVTGLIKVEGNYKVGGIIGYAYVTVTGCSVIATENGSYVKGTHLADDFEGDNVGGAIGFTGEEQGGTPKTYSGIRVENINVEGTRKVGGVVGYLHTGTTLRESSFTGGNVLSNASEDYVKKTSGNSSTFIIIGGIVGEYAANANITSCKILDAEIYSFEIVGKICGGNRSNSTIDVNSCSATNVKLYVTVYPGSDNVNYNIDGATYTFKGTWTDDLLINAVPSVKDNTPIVKAENYGDVILTQNYIAAEDSKFTNVYIALPGFKEDMSDKCDSGYYLISGFKSNMLQIAGSAQKIDISNNISGRLFVLSGGVYELNISGNTFTGDGSDKTTFCFTNHNQLNEAGTLRAVYLNINNSDVNFKGNTVSGGYRDAVAVYIKGAESTLDFTENTISGYGKEVSTDAGSTKAAIKIWTHSTNSNNMYYTGSGVNAVPTDAFVEMVTDNRITVPQDNNQCLYAVESARFLPISSYNELSKFADAVNNENSTYEGVTVYLTENIDLEGKWKPIGNVISYPSCTFAGTFDGNGKIISNMFALASGDNGKASAGFFGSITGVVKNLIIDKATVKSTHYAGGIVGYSSANVGMKIENCRVINSTITSTPELDGSSYDNGDKVGGIIGYMVAGDVVTGCTIANTTITGYRDVGGIAGYSTGTVSNCKVLDNVTLVCDNSHNYKGYGNASEYHINSIVGENGGTISNCTGDAGIIMPVFDQDDINEVINSTNGPIEIIVPKGDYELPSTTGKDVTISGTKDTVIDTTTGMPGTTGAALTFKGITIDFKENGMYSSNGFTHSEKVVYEDCIIKGTQFLYSETEFINCTFNVTGDVYSVWTYGAPKVTFTNCTFNTSGKAILVYIEKAHTAEINVEGCTFNDNGTIAGKAAIEVAESANGAKANYTINVNNCTVNGFDTTSQESSTFGGTDLGTTVWGNKNLMPADRLHVFINGVEVY